MLVIYSFGTAWHGLSAMSMRACKHACISVSQLLPQLLADTNACQQAQAKLQPAPEHADGSGGADKVLRESAAGNQQPVEQLQRGADKQVSAPCSGAVI